MMNLPEPSSRIGSSDIQLHHPLRHQVMEMGGLPDRWEISSSDEDKVVLKEQRESKIVSTMRSAPDGHKDTPGIRRPTQ